MKKLIIGFLAVALFVILGDTFVYAQEETSIAGDSVIIVDSLLNERIEMDEVAPSVGFHQVLKEKFIEGNAGFMSLIAIVLALGLALCIERIIYLSLADTDSKRLLEKIEKSLQDKDVERAKDLCRNTRGPVASICYQGLLRINERIDVIERSIMNYGTVQSGYLEKGCSWITLFITIAPSLGFLGTVIGMVMAFDDIESAGEMSSAIVAGGMKVALITTIFGLIVALILQIFYNYILSRIESINAQMENAAISLLDMILKYHSTSKD